MSEPARDEIPTSERHPSPERFERFVGELSRSLSSAKQDQLDDAIVEGLDQLARQLGLERAFLGRLRDGHLFFEHQWIDPRLRPAQASFVKELDPSAVSLARRALAGETVAVSSLAELPASAEFERQYFEEHGLKSTLFIPGTVGHETVGALVMDSFAEEKRWPDSLIEKLALPVDLLYGALLRRESAAQIEELSGFESLVSDLCASFAGVDGDQLSQAIANGLERVGEFLGAERAFMGQFTHEEHRMEFTHVWAREGLDAESQIFKLDLTGAVPWVAQQLRKGEIIRVGPGLSGLPAEAHELRAQLERDGISSGVAVPMLVHGEPIGILGLDTVERPRGYSDAIVARLRHIADVIGSTLVRRHAERDLQEALALSRDAEASLREALGENERLKKRLESENVYLRREIESERGADRIVGESESLSRVLAEAEQVAATESTVLIGGETGTGKELVAHLVHRASRRSDRPLIKVSCAALPETLVESELFGRERGAYTGAMTRQIGRFEVADGSTIFLDEIGDLPLETQVKLLRVLEEGDFERLGSSKTIHVDVRVIAATNRDLVAEVEACRFREDLFYRLNVFPIRMPPLRERPGDVHLLTWTFVQEFGAAMGKLIENISRETMSALESYPWPGNVRELRNVIERAMILCQGPTLEVRLPMATSERHARDRHTSMDAAQRRHILRVLEAAGWRVRGKDGAAERLEMKPSTLENRMKKLGIRRSR